MKKNPFFLQIFLPALLMLMFASCKKETSNLDTVDDRVSVTESIISNAAMEKDPNAGLLQAVRRATSRFNSTVQAIRAGYEPTNHCVSIPGVGGMGYHWANRSLIDPVFDPEKPEAVLYAKGPGNHLRLVAVEYIIINTGQAAPMFGNQPFDVGGTPTPGPHWSLHVWLYEHNPAGMYTPFNPNITCP